MTDRESSLKHILRHWPDVQISASRFHAPICQIPDIPRDSDIPMRERGRVWGGGDLNQPPTNFSKFPVKAADAHASSAFVKWKFFVFRFCRRRHLFCPVYSVEWATDVTQASGTN